MVHDFTLRISLTTITIMFSDTLYFHIFNTYLVKQFVTMLSNVSQIQYSEDKKTI